MKILVVGDYISDVYTFGRAERLCPEAPVPVLIPEKIYNSHGGAALVHDQLLELGANVKALFGSKSIKRRFFAGSHLICRVDEDSIPSNQIMKIDLRCNMHDPTGAEFDQWDAFVVADYGKGAITPHLAHQIVNTSKPCFIDAKNRWEWYTDVDCWYFPNENEICPWGRVVQKLGAKGCQMGELKLPATVSEVVDVTGAGDIFMAGFVYAWSLQLPAEDCLRFANEIAGESCRHIGTHVVPRQFAQEVLDRLRASRESQPPTPETVPDSTPAEPEQSIPPNRCIWIESASPSKPDVDYQEVVGVTGDGRYSPPLARILPVWHTIPTGSSDARIPTDQESSDESGTKSQTTPQSQSPISNEHQHERKLARDQVWHPKRS
jgi:bifunctional ADP-heptose synthase (sugar kinase/adenylyltransferase)